MDITFWNERYGGARYVYGTEANVFVAECAAFMPPGPALCLAEGECRNAVYLAGLGRQVTAVDQSEAGLAKGRSLARTRNVQICTLQVRLEDYCISPNSWAGIVATFAHFPVSLRRRIHGEVVAGLIPGGVFILEAYTPDQLKRNTGGPKDLGLLMTLPELRRELVGLEILIGREIVRDVHEGDGHTGQGAVVQILAKKPGSWAAPSAIE